MTMNTLNPILKTLVALVMMCFGLAVTAGEVAIIVNSSNSQSLSLADVKNIYSETLTTWANGKKIKVYEQKEDSPIREIFSQAVLGISAKKSAAAASNRKITNTSKNPAKTKRERLVISVVAKKPDAIGYADADKVKNIKGIKVIHTVN